jgi:hypothetical protein
MSEEKIFEIDQDEIHNIHVENHEFKHQELTKEHHELVENLIKEYKTKLSKLHEIKDEHERKHQILALNNWFHIQSDNSVLKFSLQDTGLSIKDKFNQIVEIVSPVLSPRSNSHFENFNESQIVHSPRGKKIHVKSNNDEENVFVKKK